jgi:hypothetical protein
VEVENDGKYRDYGHFVINDVLGRLDCPAEPRLLYFKALAHAYTSFVLPDPLTGRTGTEEALHCLRSGYCQPWTTVTELESGTLQLIAKLAPRREYYPKGRKVMQKTFWDPRLTTTIQDDGLKAAVEEIYAKSEQISVFALQPIPLAPLGNSGDIHLTLRNQSRRSAYRRPREDSFDQGFFTDTIYKPRDHFQGKREYTNVWECCTIIRKWSTQMPTTQNLAGILQNWPIIGGYTGSYDKVTLTELLATELSSAWGSLVHLCQASDFKDSYQLMFLFSIVSFREDADMNAMKVLIAFAILQDLKSLSLPQWPSYKAFQQFQHPREAETIEQMPIST